MDIMIVSFHLKVLPLSFPIHRQKTRQKDRRTSAEELTASPYKRKLEEKAYQRKKNATRMTIPKNSKKRTTKKTAKSTKQAETETEGNWHCNLCGEWSLEDMICCRSCKRWAHTACAGTTRSYYVCDFCC
ncbi:hypothetical protein V1264_023860 [Littorina saxatilis]|uniref:Zinc finger PHD-type domain-containing protein n=1 Tax=Littorina saxatilis TaxID=31220 RepID=A0AAN9GA87_9CAEN